MDTQHSISVESLTLKSEGDFAAARHVLGETQKEITAMEQELATMKARLNEKKVTFDTFSRKLSMMNSGKLGKIADIVMNVLRKENKKVSQKLDSEVVLEGFGFFRERASFADWDVARVHEILDDSVVIKFYGGPNPASSSVIVIPLRWLNLSDSEIAVEVRKMFKVAVRARLMKKHTQDLAKMEAEAQELEKAAAKVRNEMDRLVNG